MFNQFDKAANQYEVGKNLEAQKSKVTAIFADKPFSQRFKIASFGAKALALICNLFSCLSFAFLAGFLINSMLTDLVGSPAALYIAVPIALCIGVLFELIKNAANQNFFVGLFKFKNAALTAVAAITLLSFISVFTSFAGAKLLPQIAKVDTLTYDYSSFDAQKAAIMQQITDAQKGSTYKGIVTKSGHKQIAGLQSQLETLAKERDIYTAQTDKEKSSFESDKVSVSAYLGYFAIISEIVYFLCVAFNFYFAYRCYIELDLSGSVPTNLASLSGSELSVNKWIEKIKAGLEGQGSELNTKIAAKELQQITPANNPELVPHAPTVNVLPQRKIGFVFGSNSDKEADSVAASNSQTATPDKVLSPNNPPDVLPNLNPSPENIVSKYGIGTCANCQTKYHKNSYNHKYCSDACKLDFHEKKHGSKFIIPRKK